MNISYEEMTIGEHVVSLNHSLRESFQLVLAITIRFAWLTTEMHRYLTDVIRNLHYVFFHDQL